MRLPNSLAEPLHHPAGRYATRCAHKNFFFVSRKKKFMFISIAKNACTSLKRTLYRVEFGSEPDNVHAILGFREREDEVVVIDRRNLAALERYAGYVRFVVYRDPVARLLSAYHNKVLWPPNPHPYYTRKQLEGLALDPFLDVVEEALQVPDGLEIDEHIRPQSRYYVREDVDYIVRIDALTDFLDEKLGVEAVPPRNRHCGPRIEPTPAQVERIRKIYKEDYDIVPNYPA